MNKWKGGGGTGELELVSFKGLVGLSVYVMI